MTQPGTPPARGDALTCLVTGATGYIGGRLVPELLAAGHRVRCLARSPERLRDHPWAGQAEVVPGDARDPAALATALHGVDVAYYLVHALTGGPGFEERDRETARLFAEQARRAGVRRIVYLGGLVPAGTDPRTLSPHLRSRAEVGEILLAADVPATVLRAAVVIGSGSASFEMLRYLTERLPVMVTPSWVGTRIQPIAVRDVLRYLVGSARMPADVNRAFDIGGPDVLTYEQMMHRYAAVAGLPHRFILRVPMLTPRLSSHWIGLVTPVPRALARPLTESLRHEVVCDEHDIARYVPDPPGAPLGFDRALSLALQRVREAKVTTRWSSAGLPGAPSDPLPTDPDWAGGSLYTDERERTAEASPQALWEVIEGIGGEHGWYSFPLAWAARGSLDRLMGGVGIRRGRRDAARLRVGDSSTSGASRRSNRDGCCACAPRCGCPAWPGWRCTSSPSRRPTAPRRPPVRQRPPPPRRPAPPPPAAPFPPPPPPRRATGSGRSFTRGGCWGTCTGGACRPSTRPCSGAWPATSRSAPPGSRRAATDPNRPRRPKDRTRAAPTERPSPDPETRPVPEPSHERRGRPVHLRPAPARPSAAARRAVRRTAGGAPLRPRPGDHRRRLRRAQPHRLPRRLPRRPRPGAARAWRPARHQVRGPGGRGVRARPGGRRRRGAHGRRGERYAQAREERLRSALESEGRRLYVHDAVVTAAAPGAVLPTSGADHFALFTPYLRRWSALAPRPQAAAPRALEVPEGLGSEPLPDRGAVSGVSPGLARGGEREGRRLLTDWLRDGVHAYQDTHDDLAADATSRLSPHLHFGTVSAAEAVRRARAAGSPGAEAFVRQLCWRDFHHQLLAARPAAAGHDYRDRHDRWRTGRDAEEDLGAWADGRTGYPVVDAAMRQLRHEGWMHNRGRLLAASFLTKTLYVDWRAGARHFLDLLVDGDVANNQLNWQWVAGTGTDTRPNRVLNPVRQALRYDPDGRYVHRWVPELAGLAAPLVHEPWRLTAAERARYAYPEPIVDLTEALHRFRQARGTE